MQIPRTQFVTLILAVAIALSASVSATLAVARATPYANAGYLSSSQAAAQNGPLTNADVISLVSIGLDESVIAQKIRTAPSTSFDVSIDGLKVLKAAKVSNEVIHAMLESANSSAAYSNSDDPAAVHAPGIYVQVAGNDGQAHMLMLGHTEAVGAKTHGSGISKVNGVTSTIGLPMPMHGKTHVRAELSGGKSPIQINDKNPNFYVYFTEDTERFGGSDFSVRDFALLKFKSNDKIREIEIATRPESFGDSESTGIDQKVREPTVVQKIKPGIYLIKLTRPLKPGEYAFEHLLEGVFYDFGLSEGRVN
jgi:hypothetical protein